MLLPWQACIVYYKTIFYQYNYAIFKILKANKHFLNLLLTSLPLAKILLWKSKIAKLKMWQAIILYQLS